MNDFEEYFTNAKRTHPMHKWRHYFEIYDNHFKRFRGKNPTILEIGVQNGGSLLMWDNYFKGKCKIYGLDINPACKTLHKDKSNIEIIIGDQGDRKFWKGIKKTFPKFDIIIDDGGHTMMQQIVTYEEIYDHMTDNGVYLCEDLHTSYWPSYGGGLKQPNTFIEYSKNFIDEINAWHIKGHDTSFRRKTHSIHYYDSVIVLERRKDEKRPISERK